MPMKNKELKTGDFIRIDKTIFKLLPIMIDNCKSRDYKEYYKLSFIKGSHNVWGYCEDCKRKCAPFRERPEGENLGDNPIL